MKIKSCLLVDDSDDAILLTKAHLKKLPFVEVHSCHTCAEAVQILAKHNIDLIILDIRLGSESGLDLFNLCAQLPPVVILSSYPEYAIETYDLESIIDFISKPFTEERFMRAISRAFNVKHSYSGLANRDFTFFKVSRKNIRFNFESIDYIEAFGVYSKLFQGTKMNLISEPISILENILPSKNFRRIHKSYIVNIQKITEIDQKHFIINSQKIPIGSLYKPQLTVLLKLFNRGTADDF